MPSALQLVSLWIYPIKSCAGIQVSSAQVTPQSGLTGDREWVIINRENQQVWMGEIHRMALVQPRLEGETMVLQAPGVSVLKVPYHLPESPCQVKIWNDQDKVNETFSGQDAGDEASEWLTAVLGQPLRLVRLGHKGLTRKALMPLHVLSLASLRRLNQRLAERGHASVEYERFRPNLVVEHAELAPFAEEGFSSLQWSEGAPEIQFSGHCIRCIMPNVSPKDATAGHEPLVAVAALSRERQQKNPIFGVYGRALSEGVLTVGLRGRAWSAHMADAGS
ncbi:MOSC domain-containing protein [Archangium violaceum]|uniref:MOSC domain-containing protein n=1 Tax=Archangium violaceum TaxID=83451 RepID=UPI002B2BCC12|nr:MOSC domain-containing protein [Archangium violaceum]